jgi:hypothetical protein
MSRTVWLPSLIFLILWSWRRELNPKETAYKDASASCDTSKLFCSVPKSVALFTRLQPPRSHRDIRSECWRFCGRYAQGADRCNLEPTLGIEPKYPAYRAGALPLSYAGMELMSGLEPEPPRYELGASPFCHTSKIWSGMSDSNRRMQAGSLPS